VGGDGEAFREWLRPYMEELGVEVLVSDDNDSYSVAAEQLLVDHQICITHVRKYVSRRSESILEQAEREWGDGERLHKLKRDPQRVRELVDELPEHGGRMGSIHQQYSWTDTPKPGEKASAGYRMRMMTLELRGSGGN
jgi:hypothetical protein